MDAGTDDRARQAPADEGELERLRAAAAYGTRMARLQSATARLAGIIDPAEVGQALAEEVQRALEAAAVGVYVFDEEAAALRLQGALGFDAALLRRYQVLPVDTRIAVCDAHRAGEPLVFLRAADYLSAYPERAAALAGSRYQTFLALPLRVEDRSLGALTVSWEQPCAYDAAIAGLADLCAQACAMAMERVRLFASERAARERAEAMQAQLEALARVGEVLAGSLDYERTIASVTELCVPLLADWAAVDMVNEDGSFSRLGVAHVDPARVALAHEIWQRCPPRADDPHGMPAVVRTGEPEFVAEMPDAWIEERFAAHPELLAIVRGLGLRSWICLPLRVRGRPIGALTLGSAESGRRFGQDDLRLAQEVARRASLAIERARTFREAQELIRHKDEFLATVSHELRTPLNAIVGWTRMLLDGKLPPERARHALEVIARNADLQTRLISDMLDVSRAISGKLLLSVELVDVRSALAAALESVRPMAMARGVELACELPRGELPRVAGDAGRLQQVAWNLLSNAVKFSPAGGRVVASLRGEDGWIELCVRDRGEGIRADFLPFVFEPFRQADASRARRHGGLGLGLAICRTLVDLHAGTISASSEGPGLGSTFTVRLPVHPGSPPATLGRDAHPEARPRR